MPPDREGLHADALTISTETVRVLVDAQFPSWRALPLRRLDQVSTVNVIFRLGDALALRLPLRSDDPVRLAGVLARETERTRRLGGGLRFPVPEVVATGQPGPGYPLPWTVQTWLSGRSADERSSADDLDLADDLAALISEIRTVSTHGERFDGVGRGGALDDHDAWVATCLERSTDLLDVPALTALWRRLRVLPRTDADLTTHGDLIPANLLLDAHDRLCGVLDCGSAQPADPALDLVCAWHLFDAPTRARLQRALGDDALRWARGQAWAFVQAIGLVWYYRDTLPGMARLGKVALARILADPTV